MSRDIEKDKAMCEAWLTDEWTKVEYDLEALPYWIAQYEASQTRIRELEEQLHVNQRPDVKSRTGHTAALVNHFEEMRKYHAR